MKKKVFVILLSVLLVSGVMYSVFTSSQPKYSGDINSYHPTNFEPELVEGSYKAYKTSHANESLITDETVSINITEDIDESLSEGNIVVLDDGVLTDEVGKIGWRFNVNTPGKYHIHIGYEQVVDESEYGIIGKSATAERILRINGEIPFDEAQFMKFDRIWEDDSEILTNAVGDQIRPRQTEKPQLIERYLMDVDRFVTEPYVFYFEEGEHTLSFESIREPLKIKSLELSSQEPIPSYSQALQNWRDEGHEIVEGASIRVEAEHMFEKNSPTMIPLPDTSSYLTYPRYSGRETVLNVMGVYSWRLPGYWVSYEVEAPQSGLYALNFRMKQDVKQGAFVSRHMQINGEVPFEEAKGIPFTYSSTFNNYIIGSEEEPYLFYLEEGTNIIQFDVSLHNVGEMIDQVTASMNGLNQLYLDTIMYTGVTPQRFRDYQIEQNVPHLVDTLEKEYARLVNVVNSYSEISDGSRNQTAILTNLTMQIERFLNEPELIVRELASFESNISALGTWITNQQEQPLTLDHFTFFDPDIELERGKDNVLEAMFHESRRFFFSFFDSGDAFAGSGDGETTIRVWVAGGRDQAQILRRVIDDSFDENINVNLELVQPDVLLRAVVAGEGPDVALMVQEGQPIDFAYRNASLDLTQFDDFDEISERFYASAMTPFEFEGGFYALPEQHVFPVLFYRTDILEQLDLEVPNTWDEALDVMSILNMNNLDFFMESGSLMLTQRVEQRQQTQNINQNLVNTGFFGSLLFQHGGEYYNEERIKTALNSQASNEAFSMFTSFYTNYGLPTQANFVNRFRSGEIAMGVAEYALYNTLVVFAPEITGKWGIQPIPGLNDPNNNVAQSNVPFASVILEDTDHPEEAWEFLKWWTSTEVQVEYARELETVMGSAARLPTANKEALSMLSWPSGDLETILSQQENTQGIPQVPGGYMTERQYTYAFLSVVNEGRNPREVLNEYVREIDREIEHKRREFGLD